MKIKRLLFLSLLALSFYAQSQNIPSNVPLNGLVGWWPMDSSATDLSTNTNNGIVYGAVSTTDRFGNANSAFLFNGISDYIEVLDDSVLDLSTSFTLASWIKTNDYNQPLQYAIGKGRNPTGTGYALAFYDPNLGVIALNDGNSNLFVGSADTSLVSGWHHLVGTYDGATLKMYVDGTLRDSASAFLNLINSAEPLSFGRESAGIGRYFNGSLDDIGIWNRPLTSCEITSLYSESGLNLSVSSNSICFGSTSVITASNATNYNWQPGNLSGDSINVSPAITTTFTVVATNNLGCSFSDSVTIIVLPLPLVSASSNATNDSICSGEQLVLFGSGAASYSWSGGISDSVAFSPAGSQTYTVVGTALNGCNNSDSITITVNACLDIEKTIAKNEVLVFPNPAKDLVNISMNGLKGKKEIEIFDFAGRVMEKSNTNSASYQLNVSAYEKGSYVLMIKTDQKTILIRVMKKD